MNLLEYLEGAIDDDIVKEHDLYSIDSIPPNQMDYLRERYYYALWEYMKENKI